MTPNQNCCFCWIFKYFSNASSLLVSSIKLLLNRLALKTLLLHLREPSIESAQEMMLHPDVSLLVVTGGPGVVKQALQSGKRLSVLVQAIHRPL